MAPRKIVQKATPKRAAGVTSAHRFESAKLESLFVVLDAVAWLTGPGTADVAQFAGIDPRTAGKLLKNACQIGLVDKIGAGYVLSQPYPYEGSLEQKKAVVREALVRHRLLTAIRQFILLGDKIEIALRKAATLVGIKPFVPGDLSPLLVWANSLDALRPELVAEDLVDQAVAQKELRPQTKWARSGWLFSLIAH